MAKVFDYHKPKVKRNGVMAYAFVRSGSGEDMYTVVRYDNRTYRCTCPDQLFRRRRCKHIKHFINYEVVIRLNRPMSRASYHRHLYGKGGGK